MKSARLAFSLVELLVVVALCAILACGGIAINNYLYKIAVRAEVKKLYHYCVHACAKALITQQDHVIVIDLVSHCYGLEHELKLQLGSLVQFGFCSGTFGPPSSNDVVLSSACSFGDNRILCSPSGTISSGAVYLVDKNKQYMYALSSSVADVSLLRMYYHDGKRWVLL